MIQIKEIHQEQEKSNITNTILRQLPEWFGIETSIVEYVAGVVGKTFFATFEDNQVIGFIAIKENNIYTADIYVMGILKPFHHQGIGKALVKQAEAYLKEKAFMFLMVKTLDASNDDENYKKTRAFYQGVGFYPVEAFKEIWDEHNPCLIMIKSLDGGM